MFHTEGPQLETKLMDLNTGANRHTISAILEGKYCISELFANFFTEIMLETTFDVTGFGCMQIALVESKNGTGKTVSYLLHSVLASNHTSSVLKWSI